jgi:hypothetical protein
VVTVVVVVVGFRHYPPPPSHAPPPPPRPTALNSSLTPQIGNSQNTFVLPALNVSSQQQSLRNAQNLSFDFKSLINTNTANTIPSHTNVNMLFKNLGVDANHFSMPKQSPRDYRNTLNNAKTFLDNENSQLKSNNIETPNVISAPGKKKGIYNKRYIKK